MGVRLHSAAKYEVVYSQTASFNYGHEHINNVLFALTEGDLWYEGDFLDSANMLNGDRHLLLKNVEKIITPDNDWYYQEELDETIAKMERDPYFGYTRQTLYEDLKKIIEQGDPTEDKVHFFWS